MQRLQPLSLFHLASHLCSLVCSCRMLSLARLNRRHCFLQLVYGPLSSGRFIKKSRTRMGWESGDDGGGEGKEHSRGRCEGGYNHLDWTVRLLNTSRLHSLRWKIPDVVLSTALSHMEWAQLWDARAWLLKGQVPVLTALGEGWLSRELMQNIRGSWRAEPQRCVKPQATPGYCTCQQQV